MSRVDFYVLRDAGELGEELLVWFPGGLMSLTMVVPAAVPSLTQSSRPELPSSAKLRI